MSRTEQETHFLQQFGVHLRQIRVARNLTQEELADQADFSRSYYNEIETGKRNISLLNLRRLAQCLECDLPSLLEFEEK